MSEALLQEAIHASHLGLEGREQVVQEGLEPWRCCGLIKDIVHAIDP
jgi:hypothetical protein